MIVLYFYEVRPLYVASMISCKMLKIQYIQKNSFSSSTHLRFMLLTSAQSHKPGAWSPPSSAVLQQSLPVPGPPHLFPPLSPAATAFVRCTVALSGLAWHVPESPPWLLHFLFSIILHPVIRVIFLRYSFYSSPLEILSSIRWSLKPFSTTNQNLHGLQQSVRFSPSRGHFLRHFLPAHFLQKSSKLQKRARSIHASVLLLTMFSLPGEFLFLFQTLLSLNIFFSTPDRDT